MHTIGITVLLCLAIVILNRLKVISDRVSQSMPDRLHNIALKLEHDVQHVRLENYREHQVLMDNAIKLLHDYRPPCYLDENMYNGNLSEILDEIDAAFFNRTKQKLNLKDLYNARLQNEEI